MFLVYSDNLVSKILFLQVLNIAKLYKEKKARLCSYFCYWARVIFVIRLLRTFQLHIWSCGSLVDGSYFEIVPSFIYLVSNYDDERVSLEDSSIKYITRKMVPITGRASASFSSMLKL